MNSVHKGESHGGAVHRCSHLGMLISDFAHLINLASHNLANLKGGAL